MGDVWASLSDVARDVWLAADIDVSEPTLAKYALLVVGLIVLLWVLGDVYRGEIQNKAIEAELVRNEIPGFQSSLRDLLFAKATLDIGAPHLPAEVKVEFRFTIQDGDHEKNYRIVLPVRDTAYRLVMRSKAGVNLKRGQFAVPSERFSAIQARAEYEAKRAQRKFRNSVLERVNRWIRREPTPEPEIHARSYYVRIHFPANPVFLLFFHPDREVKATGWLTLLTSLFALFAQFLFKEIPTTPERGREQVPSVIVKMVRPN